MGRPSSSSLDSSRSDQLATPSPARAPLSRRHPAAANCTRRPRAGRTAQRGRQGAPAPRRRAISSMRRPRMRLTSLPAAGAPGGLALQRSGVNATPRPQRAPAPDDPRDLLHEPADRGDGQHDRERRAALDPARPPRLALGPAVDDRRLHDRDREPLLLAGSTGDRLGRRRTFQVGLLRVRRRSLLCSLAPTLGWLIAARAAAGRRRIDAQPGRDVDHHQRLHRPARARPGDRRVGRVGRDQPRARPDRRRRAHGERRLARDLLDQRADRARRGGADRAVRARVARAARAAARSGRPGARDRHAGVAHLRDHRGARRPAGPRRRRSACSRWRASLARPRALRAAPRGPADRAALLPQRAVLGRDADRGLRVRRLRRASCSSTRSTCRTSAATRRSGRAVHAADGVLAALLAARSRAASSAAAGRAVPLFVRRRAA